MIHDTDTTDTAIAVNPSPTKTSRLVILDLLKWHGDCDADRADRRMISCFDVWMIFDVE